MRPYKIALMLSTALFAHAAANAGDVTLYSGNDMTGRQFVARADIGNLQSTGFNDRAMSLVVNSGTWEACTDSEFRGQCRVFEAGAHRNLDRFTNQISSLRQLESDRGQGRERGRGRGRDRDQGVMLFDGTDLRGRSVALRSDANTLVPMGFNDLAQSMVIRGGAWEFCQHTDFRGKCRVFEPGEYRGLGRNFHRSISSARRVGDGDQDRRGDYGQRDSNGNAYGDPRDQRDQRDQRDGYGGAVELFTGPGYGGQRLPVSNEIRSLDEVNFNDRAGSLVIQSGQWEFCEHSEFRGQCAVYGPGRYDRLGPLHNAISSLRRVR